MNSFLIFANPDKDVDLKLSHELSDYLDSKGAKTRIYEDDFGRELTVPDLEAIDAVIVLGGDGTVLRAARFVGKNDVPILGINLGTLGFLAEVDADNAKKAIDRLLLGDYKQEERMMCDGETNGKVFHALNDIVITRAGFCRVIGLNIYVNGELLDTYEADGVIVSTPTGSTGYNMSAGGPIVSPKTKAILVTPISPHSLTAKSVVFDTSDVIEIELVKQRKTQETEAIVSFDGGNSIELSAGDRIKVSVSELKTSFIKMYDVNFFNVLRDKIGR